MHESKQTRGRRASGASTRSPEPKKEWTARTVRSKSERKGGAKGSLEKLSNDLTGAGQPGMEDPFVQAMMQISKNNNAVLAKA